MFAGFVFQPSPTMVFKKDINTLFLFYFLFISATLEKNTQSEIFHRKWSLETPYHR